VGKFVFAAVGAASVLFVGTAYAETATRKVTATQKIASVGKPATQTANQTTGQRVERAPGVEIGMASVYCFRNGPTASGERSRPAVLTAAHKTLPFGTLVEVTNRNNGRSIVVRINDRGPFVDGRVIDLTPAAALALKLDGLAPVTLRVLNHRRDERLVARAI
jgi:rare lipoprotein A